MRVVAELCEHPGAEDRSQAGLAEDDLSGRVPPKKQGQARHPISDLPPGHRRGHGLSPGLTAQIEGVLTRQRLPVPSLSHGDPVALIRSRLIREDKAAVNAHILAIDE